MNERSSPALTLEFSLNGVSRQCITASDRRLSAILRDDFGLNATRTACGIGRCGACMVLVNDRPINACLVMAWQIDGAAIITAEGIDALPEGRMVQAALIRENAFQCGYCAPGFVVSLTALLRERPTASEADIKHALAGNICRCTGYHSILRGALQAVDMLAEQRHNQSDVHSPEGPP